MLKLMIVVASVRPGRIGRPIADWARGEAEKAGFDIDFADLAELALPMMDEPNHPVKRQYTKPHTVAWSERVDAAEAFLFVTPEYNHSYAPALKNALDYLAAEWKRKPVAFVSYGGISAGTRGVAALEPVLTALGLVKTGAANLPFAGKQVVDGAFVADERQSASLGAVLGDLEQLARALAPARSA